MVDWSLTSGAIPVTLSVLGLLAGIGLLAGRNRQWWTWRVPVALGIGVAAAVTVALVVDHLWRPFPDQLPRVVVVTVGLITAALALAVARPGSWRPHALAAGAVLLVVVAGAVQINQYFDAYPTIRSALGMPLAHQRDLTTVARTAPRLVAATPGVPLSRTWTRPANMPATGAVSTATIPGRRSGFQARPAWVYLPPAYLSAPRAELPVLVLLPGQPGAPRDWFDGGQLASILDKYAAAHAGLAPVVVVADPTGAELGSTLCVDSRAGHAYTYLTVDVPAWIRANLQVDPDPRRWAVGGMSAGGTCALQLAVNAQRTYPSFVDISGQAEPTIGTQAQTINQFFGGDPAAFQRIDPLHVLAVHTFTGSAGYIVAGRDDSVYRPQARRVFAATRAAGMDVTYVELPGGHNWRVWSAGLNQAVPWLTVRFGLVG
jgi:S-formylglutathione hydrolase FrmB